MTDHGQNVGLIWLQIFKQNISNNFWHQNILTVHNFHDEGCIQEAGHLLTALNVHVDAKTHTGCICLTLLHCAFSNVSIIDARNSRNSWCALQSEHIQFQTPPALHFYDKDVAKNEDNEENILNNMMKWLWMRSWNISNNSCAAGLIEYWSWIDQGRSREPQYFAMFLL